MPAFSVLGQRAESLEIDQVTNHRARVVREFLNDYKLHYLGRFENAPFISEKCAFHFASHPLIASNRYLPPPARSRGIRSEPAIDQSAASAHHAPAIIPGVTIRRCN